MAREIKIEDSLPKTNLLTKSLFAHGGLYRPLKTEIAKSVFASLVQAEFMTDDNPLVKDIETNAQKIIDNFFFRIVENKAYEFSDELIIYLTDKKNGKVLSPVNASGKEILDPNSKIPTFMVFVGQFIDHDITLNPINLIGRGAEPGDKESGASAFIDLDSVYGGDDRIHLVSGELWSMVNNTDGKFKLRKIDKNAFDLPRNDKNEAYIFDARNDENQLILQIHILIMRLHNKLAEQFPAPDQNNPDEVKKFYFKIKEEVLRTWQSFIWNEYLPTLVADSPLKWAIDNLTQTATNFGMAHEFALAFRMGHSQLRPFYHLNPQNTVELFEPRSNGETDLRGSKQLTKEHTIDWPFFIDENLSNQTSNKIDTKVTRKVFDLPDSAIPDQNKQVKNLPERNLLRSIQVGISSAEEIAQHFSLSGNQILTPEQIEPDAEKRALFTVDGNFKTPLWYYILKEAEIQNQGAQLGDLGGRIIAQQLLGGIYFQKDCFLNNGWKSQINGTNKVTFREIVEAITEL
ncbi:MAG: peroxidase family protein [Ferruginibacter sp.]